VIRHAGLLVATRPAKPVSPGREINAWLSSVLYEADLDPGLGHRASTAEHLIFVMPAAWRTD
jgi:hypothetical protein